MTAPSMCGYLQKKAKTGKWQKRWFETNAHFLTYYKSKKMEKLLAALNLPQVGEILLVEPDSGDPDNDGSLFTIELHERVYTMKATSREEAARWVEVLKLLQSSEADEPKVTTESPHATMMRNAEGVSDQLGNTAWKKESKCCGLCQCFQG
ncbi:unnamed protein product [Chrysoparadoxa australica]